MANKSISEYASKSDSVSLKGIDGKKFTIAAIEDSNYEDDGNVTEGVKITTKESFEVDGSKVNKFHTTRTAVVNKLRSQDLRDDLKLGHTIGPMMCKLVPSKKGGKDYWDLVE